MKQTLSLLLGLAFCGAILAQEYTTVTTPTTVTYALLSAPAKVTKITLTATTGAATLFKLYDSTNTVITNITTGAYVYPVQYATNYWVLWSNSIVTPTATNWAVYSNNFAGTYTAWATNAGAAKERVRVLEVTVPANSTRYMDVTRFLKEGLVVNSSAAGLAEVEYYP
jgi:hypothetical protein